MYVSLEESMTVAHTFFRTYQPPFTAIAHATQIEEMAQQGIEAIFRARPAAASPKVLGQLERRDRIVLLLLDGKRTVQDVARLIHRDELEIAHILVRLLQYNYVEFLETDRREEVNIDI